MKVIETQLTPGVSGGYNQFNPQQINFLNSICIDGQPFHVMQARQTMMAMQTLWTTLTDSLSCIYHNLW